MILTDDEILRRKAYLQITAEDEALLREVHPLLATKSAAITEQFYEFLLAHPSTRRMLEAPGLLPRLKKLQAQYFERLTSGEYGRAYFEDRVRVGDTHNRVGLPPELYLGAYNRYLAIVTDVLRQGFPPGDDRYFNTVKSITKLVMLDMSLAIDAYIESAHAALAQRNGEIAHALVQLERLQGAKQTLTDMIVHDLQNPLTGIRSFLELLGSREGGLSASEQEALQEAMRRCNDLGQMILNVLHVSRSEAGALEVYLENLDIADIVKRSASAFDLHAAQQGRSVVVDAPVPVPFRSDQTLLKRVLYNLIFNAIRHTPRGTHVAVRVVAAGADRVEIEVADDGPGIPAAVQPLLFERFGGPALRSAGLRVDTGLGLAFCRVALEALGGTIQVKSDGQRGTRFQIVLPKRN
ncbi:MAG: hypothetical protein K8T20_15220 [Planctomycetes bacterium]|nr:hypothetical protein [Planctomycetota bacterium]